MQEKENTKGSFPLKKKKLYLKKPFKRLINFNLISCLANFITDNHSFLEAKTENIMSPANPFPLKFFFYVNCNFWLLAVVGLFWSKKESRLSVNVYLILLQSRLSFIHQFYILLRLPINLIEACYSTWKHVLSVHAFYSLCVIFIIIFWAIILTRYTVVKIFVRDSTWFLWIFLLMVLIRKMFICNLPWIICFHLRILN